MNARLAAIAQKIDAMTLRERGLLFGSFAAALVMGWQLLLMDPLEARQRENIQAIASAQQEMEAFDSELRILIEQHGADPETEYRRRSGELQAAIAATDTRIGETVQGLVEPRQMARVLEDVLSRRGDLKLVGVQSLPAEPLLPKETAAGVYRHGLRLVLEGSYLGTLGYLRELQALSQTLYWDEVDIQMLEYPRAKVSITVHTLGLTEGWIGV